EHAVARSRGAAPLDVAEHRDPSLEAGALLDLAGERVADAALGEPYMAELVLLALVGEPLELVALRDDDDREVLAALVAAADVVAGLVDRDRLLGNHDHVGAAGDPAHDHDPARVAAHHLDDHDAVVRLGGRVEAVDRFGSDEDGRVESERVIGPVEIVVDRLRDADDGELVFLVQARRYSERVLATDRNEGVQSRSLERLSYSVDAAFELVGIRPRRPEN